MRPTAHAANRTVAFLAVNVDIFCCYRDSCAKKAAAFFKNSISVLASRSLVFKRLISAIRSDDAPSISGSGCFFLCLFTQLFKVCGTTP